MTGVPIKKIIDEVLHVKTIETLRTDIERIFLDSLLGGSPRTLRRELSQLVTHTLVDPTREVLEVCEVCDALREAYIDVAVYQTPVQEAAKDAECAAGDLIWLLGKRPVTKGDREHFRPSRELKKQRKKVAK